MAYNMGAAAMAVMSMMDKLIEYRAIPQKYLLIDDIPIHFSGEYRHSFVETIIEGSVEKNKFIVWYVMGEEVIGFCTVGYNNLHIYLAEAMKLLIMPSAIELRRKKLDHKAIVAKVLKCRPDIICKRKDVIGSPSVQLTEFTRERDEKAEFQDRLK